MKYMDYCIKGQGIMCLGLVEHSHSKLAAGNTTEGCGAFTMSDEEGGGGRNGGDGGKRDGGEGGGKNHNKYRKDKPWDSASIDHWSTAEWKDETMKVNSSTILVT